MVCHLILNFTIIVRVSYVHIHIPKRNSVHVETHAQEISRLRSLRHQRFHNRWSDGAIGDFTKAISDSVVSSCVAFVVSCCVTN